MISLSELTTLALERASYVDRPLEGPYVLEGGQNSWKVLVYV